MNVFLVNVGANASHGGLRSPIFSDNRFEFVPIPENKVIDGNNIKSNNEEIIPSYQNLFKNKVFIPRSLFTKKAHNDPEFKSFTYGDYPTKTPRVFLMRHIQKGDLLFFLARLTKWKNKKFTEDSGFFLIGFFQICTIIKDVYTSPCREVFDSVKENAHFKRAIFNSKFYDGFWIFKGNERSKKFEFAVPFDKEFADAVMRDRLGEKWKWKENRSINQIIGSYTRSCRWIKEKEPIKEFIKRVEKYNELGL